MTVLDLSTSAPAVVSVDRVLSWRELAPRVGCPYELELIGSTEGTRSDELALHARFNEQRIRGEWFRATHELIATAERLSEHGAKAQRARLDDLQERMAARFLSGAA